MIRVYDGLGRLKQEIDPTRDDYYLHVSYVREHPPYHEVDDSGPWRGDQLMRRDALLAEKAGKAGMPTPPSVKA